MSNDSDASSHRKQTYRISRSITAEEIEAKRNIVTPSLLKTIQYLNNLDKAQNLCDVPPYCHLRYKG